jgi:hypothetical protein
MKRVSFFLLFAWLLSPAISAQQAAVVFSALDNSIDFKTAKAGDAIALHTTRDLVDSGKVLLPRGTALTAKILAADGHSISLALDTATLKTGKTVPLVGIIAAVAFQESRDLAGDPLYGMNSSTEASQHKQSGSGLDPDASIATSGAAAKTAVLEGVNRSKYNLSADSQGAIGIEGLQLTWVLDKPPATTVFTTRKKNFKIVKGSEMLLRMAPPEN